MSDIKHIAQILKAGGMSCNCDLDSWQPEPTTGHSCVCRIHKEANRLFKVKQNET